MTEKICGRINGLSPISDTAYRAFAGSGAPGPRQQIQADRQDLPGRPAQEISS